MVFEIIITIQCHSFVVGVHTLSYVLDDDRDFPCVYYNFADGPPRNRRLWSPLSLYRYRSLPIVYPSTFLRMCGAMESISLYWQQGSINTVNTVTHFALSHL